MAAILKEVVNRRLIFRNIRKGIMDMTKLCIVVLLLYSIVVGNVFSHDPSLILFIQSPKLQQTSMSTQHINLQGKLRSAFIVKNSSKENKPKTNNNNKKDKARSKKREPFPLEINKDEQDYYKIPLLPNITKSIKNIKSGGRRFMESSPDAAAAIIVPLRSRGEHIKIFVSYMHGFLQHQNVSYRIYVIEQTDDLYFNHGLLVNIGVRKALSDYPYKCLFLHDVDLLPENQNVSYACPPVPTHLCSSHSSYNYDVPYPTNFGGVVAVPVGDFMACNGMSNLYWGWGGEDDDIRARLLAKGIEISRRRNDEGRYFHLKHPKNMQQARNRFDILEDAEMLIEEDGINTMPKYLKKLYRYKFYTKITANLIPSFQMQQREHLY